MQTEMLQKLRSKLPHRWQKQAAADLGLSRSTLSQMVNGKQRMALPVAEYLINMVEAVREAERETEKKIKTL